MDSSSSRYAGANRTQMSEEEYMRSRGATTFTSSSSSSSSSASVSASASSDPSSNTTVLSSVPSLSRNENTSSSSPTCSSCVLYQKQKLAAFQQLQSLTKQNHLLENDIENLHTVIDKGKEIILQLLTTINGAALDIDISTYGIDEFLNQDQTLNNTGSSVNDDIESTETSKIDENHKDGTSTNTVPSQSTATVSSLPLPVSTAKPIHQYDTLDNHYDIYTEGNGDTLQRSILQYSPHGHTTNILTVDAIQFSTNNNRSKKSTIDTLVFSGGADKQIIVSLITSPSSFFSSTLTGSIGDDGTPLPPIVLTQTKLSAPILRIKIHPSVKLSTDNGLPYGILTIGCMDGFVYIYEYHCSYAVNNGSNLSIPLSHGQTTIQCTLTQHSCIHTHQKYITKIQWSPTGTYLAIGSADRSLSLYRYQEISPPSTDSTMLKDNIFIIPKIQQFYFNRGSVEALAWTKETLVVSDVPPKLPLIDVETLVIAVRDAPVLYYLRCLNPTTNSSTIDHNHSGSILSDTLLSCQGIGQYFPSLHSSFFSSSLTESLLPIHLWMYRLPLSEDSTPIDITWSSIVQRWLKSSSSSSNTYNTYTSDASIARDNDITVQNPSSTVSTTAASNDNTDDEDVYRVQEALRTQTITSTMDGTLIQSTGNADIFPGYIKVGYTVTELVSSNSSTGTLSTLSLLAAATDTGIIYVYHFGTNKILRRLIGYSTSSASSSSSASIQCNTCLVWSPISSVSSVSSLPDYLIVTSDQDYALVVYSIGSGKIIRRLNNTTVKENQNLNTNTSSSSKVTIGGHTGIIKDITIPNRTALPNNLLHTNTSSISSSSEVTLDFLSCGFDKRIIGWM